MNHKSQKIRSLVNMLIHRRAVVVVITMLFVLKMGGCLLTRKYIFPKVHGIVQPKVTNGKLVKIKNGSRHVYGYFSKRGKKLIVIFHGNGTTMANEAVVARTFYNHGMSTLLVEYSGYGYARKESASESNIYDDSEHIIQHIQKKYNFSVKDTTAWGRSLGSGVAVEMLKRESISKAILVTPYTSIADVASYKYVPILPYFLIVDNFNSLGKSFYIDEEVLLIHGKRDKLTPWFMSKRLHKTFKNSTLITLDKANHYNVLRYLNKNHWRRIVNFLYN